LYFAFPFSHAKLASIANKSVCVVQTAVAFVFAALCERFKPTSATYSFSKQFSIILNYQSVFVCSG